VSKYEYIDSQKNNPIDANPVTKMCLWLGASTSGFCHWAMDCHGVFGRWALLKWGCH
jgi:hypothetical protein